jgi:hypothetical protein
MGFIVDRRNDWENNTLKKLVERGDFQSIKITFLFSMVCWFVAGIAIGYVIWG